MIMAGDFIEDKHLLVIRRLDWSDVKKKLDDTVYFELYPHVYNEEEERYNDQMRTHEGLWEVMDQHV